MPVVVVSAEEYERLKATAGRRLNVGCGQVPMMLWTNLDADPAMPAEVHATVPPLPFEDESLDEIYAGHLLEHLAREKATEFVAECYRCLVPGGRLGVLVPDTREIMTRYLAGAMDAVEFPLGVWHHIADLDDVCATFLYSTIQDSPHLWSYDRDSLARLLHLGGFERLTEMDRYGDPRIMQGAWYQVGIDGYKPEPPKEPEDEWPATFDDEDDGDE